MAALANIGIYLIFGLAAIALLPSSPFNIITELMTSIPYLDILNWFVPVTEIIAIGQAWLLAVGTFYVISMVLRWIKIIGD